MKFFLVTDQWVIKQNGTLKWISISYSCSQLIFTEFYHHESILKYVIPKNYIKIFGVFLATYLRFSEVLFTHFYWAACAPSHKMGFRSSVSKSGLPGEGRHEGLVPRNDVLTNGFIWVSLARTLHGHFLYLVCAPPEKPTKRCEPEEGYLRCSKRFDQGVTL